MERQRDSNDQFGSNVPMQFCDEDEEIFIGDVNETEKARMDRFNNRRTLVFVPGFRRNRYTQVQVTSEEEYTDGTMDRDSLNSTASLATVDYTRDSLDTVHSSLEPVRDSIEPVRESIGPAKSPDSGMELDYDKLKLNGSLSDEHVVEANSSRDISEFTMVTALGDSQMYNTYYMNPQSNDNPKDLVTQGELNLRENHKNEQIEKINPKLKNERRISFENVVVPSIKPIVTKVSPQAMNQQPYHITELESMIPSLTLVENAAAVNREEDITGGAFSVYTPVKHTDAGKSETSLISAFDLESKATKQLFKDDTSPNEELSDASPVSEKIDKSPNRLSGASTISLYEPSSPEIYNDFPELFVDIPKRHSEASTIMSKESDVSDITRDSFTSQMSGMSSFVSQNSDSLTSQNPSSDEDLITRKLSLMSGVDYLKSDKESLISEASDYEDSLVQNSSASTVEETVIQRRISEMSNGFTGTGLDPPRSLRNLRSMDSCFSDASSVGTANKALSESQFSLGGLSDRVDTPTSIVSSYEGNETNTEFDLTKDTKSTDSSDETLDSENAEENADHENVVSVEPDVKLKAGKDIKAKAESGPIDDTNPSDEVRSMAAYSTEQPVTTQPQSSAPIFESQLDTLLAKLTSESLEKKKQRLEELREDKMRLQREIEEQEHKIYPRSPKPKAQRPVEGAPMVIPKVACTGIPALTLNDRELNAVTTLHTICNGQQIVKVMEKPQTPTIIRHCNAPKTTKAAVKSTLKKTENTTPGSKCIPKTRVKFNENTPPAGSPYRHSPRSATTKKSKPILQERSQKYTFPFSGQVPSPIVVTKPKRTHKLADLNTSVSQNSKKAPFK
ncbi:unnamed protein product [Owenia fusiformis]|uniref:Uncharacterized protein n=1 Tax=Owenia fusiformis TaxID=6347 RepID=A0A8J1UKJ7_OWEFU|nr:unnamed protein product [Owenia fusiformis]